MEILVDGDGQILFFDREWEGNAAVAAVWSSGEVNCMKYEVWFSQK